MGYLAGCDEQCISELHDVKVLSLGVTQHFVDEINWMLDPTISAQPPPPFNNYSCTNHIACSRYVKLEVFVGFQGY
jgi:hypothetical protein